MSNLTIGLLGALLATNQPQAVSNLVQDQTGMSVPVTDPNDPEEQELHTIMVKDDAVLDEINSWISTNQIPRSDTNGTAAFNHKIKEQLEGVKVDYQHFLRNHPQSGRGYLAYGSFLNDIGEEESAKVQYQNSRQLDPKNPAVWNQLANLDGESGELTNAFAEYAEAIRLDPSEPVYYQNFATTVYLFRKDAREFYGINEQQVFDKALGLYQQAMKLLPDDLVLATDYAESYYGIKPMRTNDALVAWTNCLNICKDDNEREGVLIHLSRVKIAAGMFSEAQGQLDSITNPVFGDMKGRLQRMLNLYQHLDTNSVPSRAARPFASPALQGIKTIFIIPLENHDLVQADPTGSPEQLLGNPACPYFNSLITPGNSNAVQTAWATHYFSCAINGEHPSEPNYIWTEAGTDFGVRTDHDPSFAAGNMFTNVTHLTGQLTAAGVPWRSYQEDVEYGVSPLVSASGAGAPVNPYNGTTQYSYAVKHNPMAFFPDTWTNNVYPLTNFWTDLANNNVGRYNWISPDQYNEMHSALNEPYTRNGVAWTGNQSAIASGDNFLSIVIPRIMASQAYRDHGVIIIWTDETESTDDTNTTLPFVVISPLAKGNAYASTLPYSHSSYLKTMDEIFGLAYQTNAIPAAELNAQNTGYNYVNGSSATVNDLGDLFQGAGAEAPSVGGKPARDSRTNVMSLSPDAIKLQAAPPAPREQKSP